MEEFSFSTRIFFGEGALERLRRVQDKKVMIVTDRFMAGIGVPDKVAGHLTRCQVSVFDGVVPDPPIEVVAAGVQALQDCGAEVMIAVGGGSTIDAAKAIRAVARRLCTSTQTGGSALPCPPPAVPARRSRTTP
ncbi:MAG: iron-containing alcohol dehydrogenase [Flavonifractor plautii]